MDKQITSSNFSAPPDKFPSVDLKLCEIFGCFLFSIGYANAKCLAESKVRDLTIFVIPEQGHFFLSAPGQPPNIHQFGKMRMSALLTQQIKGWLRKQVEEKETD